MNKRSIITMIHAVLLVGIMCTLLAACTSKKDPVAAFPDKEVRVIVAFAPGGQTDLIIRKLNEIMQKDKNIPLSILTVNMPGGNTADALNATKSAQPDGYTYFLHHTNLVTNYIMGNITIKYDEFEMVGEVIEQGFGLVARIDDNRWPTAVEFIRDAKANPGTISVCFPGFASPGHFALLQLLAANNALGTVKEVPYPGGAESITAHLGGHVDLRATNMGDSARFVKAGEIKYLCMISQERNPDYPDVISLKDMGSSQEGLILRTGFFAPKGTPKGIQDKFMGYVKQAAETDEFKEFAKNSIMSIVLRNGADFKAKYDEDFASVTELAKGLTKK